MESPEKKDEILKAANECFSRYGYEKTTLDDIGKLVGLNKASLYYYYKNKESIFAEVVNIEMNKFITEIEKKIEKIDNCKDKVIAFIKGKIDFFSELVNINNLSVETLLNVQPVCKDQYEKVCDSETGFISKILDCCINKGEIIKCDTKRIAGTINSVIDAIKIKGLQESRTKFISEVDYKGFIDEVIFTVSLILDGLKK